MRKLILLSALLLTAPLCAQDLNLTHARVYTSPDAPALTNATIFIHNGKIRFIGSHAFNTPNQTTIDCTGLTITAGFWNSHVHIFTPTLLHAETKLAPQLNPELESMFTRWGFTTVFDISSILANTNQIRMRIASGELTGPRIFTTGEPVIGPGGIPVYLKQFLADNHITIPETTSPAEATALVDQHARDHAEAIKIFAGSIEEDGVLLLPPDIARAAVDEAHKQHMLVFSHPSSIKGVELSLSSGVDILAHVSTFEGPWSPALIQRMLDAHTSLIPTLTLFDVEAQKVTSRPNPPKNSSHSSSANCTPTLPLAAKSSSAPTPATSPTTTPRKSSP